MKTFHEFGLYNRWANETLLDLCGPLTDELLDRRFAMGYETLRATLYHIWAAEDAWLCRWDSTHAAGYSFDVNGESLAEIRARFETTWAARARWLSSMSPERMRQRLTVANRQGVKHDLPYDGMLLHVLNHGVYHRAQVLNMMRHVGAKLPEPGIDYIYTRRNRADSPPPMDIATLHTYFRYADWARERVHAAARDLSDAQLDRRFDVGVGTLRQTLLHIRFAEEWWLQNWTLGPGRPFPEAPESSSIAALDDLFSQTAIGRNAFMAELHDADLDRPITVQPQPDITRVFPLGVTMLQMCCHGTHHRAQAVNMLRQLGVAPPAVDVVIWLRELADCGERR